MACNPRNPRAATVRNRAAGAQFNNIGPLLNLHGPAIEVDYRGYDVTVEAFLRVLTGRHMPSDPRSRRLLSDDRSNVLVYLSGHGGDEFLKFQDQNELTANDIADAVAQMRDMRRMHELLLLTETCQAGTLATQLYTPGVYALGSSDKGENSLSHHADPVMGLTVIDRFTFYTLEHFEGLRRRTTGAGATIGGLLRHLRRRELRSTPTSRNDLIGRSADEVPLTDFFGDVRHGAAPTPAPSMQHWPRVRTPEGEESIVLHEFPEFLALALPARSKESCFVTTCLAAARAIFQPRFVKNLLFTCVAAHLMVLRD